MDFTLANVKTLDRGVSKIYAMALKAPENKDYLEMATVVTSKNRVESYVWLGDIPGMTEWTDARQKAQLTDYKYDIAKKDWETSFYVTRDDFIFDNLGIVKTKVAMTMAAVNDHYNEIVGGLIAANGNCFDGKKFFDGHVVSVKGSNKTYTNKSDYKLTEDNVFAVIAKMKAIKKTNGHSMRIKPTTIYVAANLEQTANAIFNSTVIAGSTNTAHAILKVKVLDDMADDTWCVADNSRPVKPFILQITKKADKVDRLTENVLEGKKIYYGVDTMDNAGYSFWQLAHFCDGTETVPAE